MGRFADFKRVACTLGTTIGRAEDTAGVGTKMRIGTLQVETLSRTEALLVKTSVGDGGAALQRAAWSCTVADSLTLATSN